MWEVAAGVQYIHSEGIVHGDLRGVRIWLSCFVYQLISCILGKHTPWPRFTLPNYWFWIDSTFRCHRYSIQFTHVEFCRPRAIRCVRKVWSAGLRRMSRRAWSPPGKKPREKNDPDGHICLWLSILCSESVMISVFSVYIDDPPDILQYGTFHREKWISNHPICDKGNTPWSIG